MIAGRAGDLGWWRTRGQPRAHGRDLLSQAEHDRLSSAVLVCDSMVLAEAWRRKSSGNWPSCRARKIARASIEKNGKIIVADDLREGVRHRQRTGARAFRLCVRDPFALLAR